MTQFSIVLLSFVISSAAYAGSITRGDSVQNVTLNEALSDITPGTVLIVSENHGYGPHYANQKSVLNELALRWPHVSVGLEFFEQRFQSEVDSFVVGNLAESDFLTAIGWGSIPFEFYREQALFPSAHGGETLALNASRVLTGKVAKMGLSSLTNEDWNEIPDNFTLGNSGYLERFNEVMSGHVPPEKIPNYFAAQSIWDENMASQACKFIIDHPEQILVVIVGDFHATYGGGLPDRMRARGCPNVTVISQVNSSRMTEDEVLKEISPSAKWGPRSDFVWAD